MGAARAGVDRPAMDPVLGRHQNLQGQEIPVGHLGISGHRRWKFKRSFVEQAGNCASRTAPWPTCRHLDASPLRQVCRNLGSGRLVDCHVGSRCPSPFWVLAGPATAPFLGWLAAERLQNGLGEYHLSFQGELERASMLSVIPHGLPRPLPRPLPLTGASASWRPVPASLAATPRL